ncbi:MAG: hypothetical protein PVI90_11050 [Desulfobacteraceae bacterium]
MRIKYPDTLYHMMSCDNGEQDINRSDGDRNTFVELLADLVSRFSLEIYAYKWEK